MSVNYKDAQKDKEEPMKELKRKEKESQKEENKKKKNEEKDKKKEERQKRKSEEKQKKINGIKLMSQISRDKMFVEFLDNEENKTLTKEDILKKIKDDLNSNLDLLAKFSKQEKLNN
jgi:hypothetical protein